MSARGPRSEVLRSGPCWGCRPGLRPSTLTNSRATRPQTRRLTRPHPPPGPYRGRRTRPDRSPSPRADASSPRHQQRHPPPWGRRRSGSIRTCRARGRHPIGSPRLGSLCQRPGPASIARQGDVPARLLRPLIIPDDNPVVSIPERQREDPRGGVPAHIGVSWAVQVRPQSFERKTRDTFAPPVPNQALPSPCATRQVPLAANAPSPGNAGGIPSTGSPFQFLPPSLVVRITKCPSTGSPSTRPCRQTPRTATCSSRSAVYRSRHAVSSRSSRTTVIGQASPSTSPPPLPTPDADLPHRPGPING
jgi:hypothetical protein